MSKLSNNRPKGITKSGLHVVDYIIFAAAALFCFLVFQQRDLLHTAGCSYGYLNGHLLSFYDYCNECGIHPAYMPSTYLLFAIWNFPMRLFGVVTVPTEDIPLLAVMWAKLLPCLVWLLCAPVIRRICMELGMEDKKSRLCTYACMSAPVAFYAQFIFGQYDCFMTFFTLLGVLYYLKKREKGFIVCFAIAVTFKYSALLLFLPLLLLRQKNFWRIVISLALAAVPFAVCLLIYHRSPAFSAYVFGLGGTAGDNPAGYILNAGYYTGFTLMPHDYKVSLSVMVFAVICGFAYFTWPNDERSAGQWAFYLAGLVFFVLFGLSKWHPQWLLFAVPYWCIGAFLHKDTKIFMILDLLFMAVYIVFNVQMIPDNVDQAMFNHGILGGLVGGDIGTELMMKDLIGKVSRELCLSLLTAVMLVYALFKHPKYLSSSPSAEVKCAGWLRTRLIGGLAVFVLPAFACLYVALRSPDPAYQVKEAAGVAVLRELGDSVSQTFRSRGTSLDKLQFIAAVNGQENQGYIKLTLKDADGKILYEEDWPTADFVEQEVVTARLGSIPAVDGAYYTAVFEATQALGDFKAGIWCSSGHVTDDANETAVMDGQTMDFQLDMTVYQH